MAAFELSCLLVIFIIFVNAPAAPVLETLGPQVNPTLAVSSLSSLYSQGGEGSLQEVEK